MLRRRPGDGFADLIHRLRANEKPRRSADPEGRQRRERDVPLQPARCNTLQRLRHRRCIVHHRCLRMAGMSDIAVAEKQWFGHPRGLATLFFTEMWERFSYYGMRALLTLYMVGSVMQPGLGFSVEKGTHIYALYTMMVYLMGVPGGWLAHRYLW